MVHDSKIFKTTPLSLVLKLETVCDKCGNILHCVSSCTGVYENSHVFFKHLSSAIDYIESNFK